MIYLLTLQTYSYLCHNISPIFQTNSCDCTSQDRAFDLEKYGPYLDKIRALFVPSLEYRVRSLLKEFVYSTDSRWAKQFPCFKRFVDTIATWKGHLNRIAEYDIGTMEEIMRNTVAHIAKDDLITCFLDAIILHHRLNKVCRELDALGIDDNILRSLTVWNFVNERNCLLDRDCFTNFNTTTDTGTCNGNLNTVMSADAKGSAKCKKIVPLATNIHDGSAEHVQPTTSEYREHPQIFDSNRNFLQQRNDNSNHYSTCGATGSRDDNAKKANGSLNEEPCESKKIRNNLKLKIIVHKMYLDDYECMTVSSFNVVPLPCKPSHLIKRIFEADPSLSESCLIVMKRKFQDSMYNVCSCLNDVLGKLNIKFINTLCLNCEIYPGYISFKLKSSASNNIKKYFFVARVPICQNIRKRAIQQDSIILSSNSKSSTEVDELKCSEQCKDNGTSLTFEHIDEETEKFDNTHCSRSNQSFLQDITIDIHETKEKNSNEKKIECITEDASEDITDLTICSCNKSCEEISNVTSHIDNSEGRNEEYCKVSSSTGINNNTTKESKEKILESNTLIAENDTQLIDNANCMCSSYENSIEARNGTEEIFSNKDLDSFSQATGVNEYDCTCSSDKETNPRNEADNANICRIASFVQNPECDKQLVELNYNCFSNNIKTIDSDAQGDNSSLNSAKVEVGCDSCCSHQSDDVIDITVIDNSSNENIVCTFKTSQDDLNTVKTQSMDYSKATQVSSRNNNLLTVSVQTPRSKIISSKRTNISKDTSYPETIRLTFDDYESIPTIVKTNDKHNEIENSSIPALILSKKTNRVLPHINNEVLDMRDGMRDFITSSKGFSASKKRLNGDSKSSSISTGEYSCTRNQSICATSNASLCRSFATISEFTMCNRRDEFRKSSDKSRKLSNRREHRLEFHGSWNGIRNVTSTTIKRKRALRKNPDDDYSIEIQPQTIFAITKFRNSVDKSVDRIKRLIRAKLGNILFNNKIDNNSKEKTFWKNEEFSGDSKRQKTSGRCIRQNYSITSCSTCNCCKQSCIRSSCESSNVILPICRNKEKSEKDMKFCNRRSVNGSEVSLNLRSIKTSPWSYNFLTSAVEDIEEQKLNRNNRPRYNKRKKVQNIMNYDRNSCRCNFGNSGTSITLSSQSTEMSLIANDSECLGHYTCKRQEKTCNNGRICKQIYNRDQQKSEEMRHKYRYGEKEKYQYIPIEYSNGNSIKGSLSHTRRKNSRNIHKQFYDKSEQKNAKRFASSRKNRQIFEKDTSDCFDNNSLYRRHVFAILTDACNDCMDDLDLDFNLGLLRYVELCKSVKRLLMRTLRSDDIYKVSTMPDSNL
ncbi:uncharacterized protein LOC105429694 [Pogonomyrmex barbatus]|uniref:Uncharacterized protein LOC105429694 n=1 Tax=Pogonomyrmex barbatus TaxID=144034 RepID=A0A6I9WNK7_9HYME|nr:uncharacterized protein LOC105429694 [Pogonomyrmex barbatus]